MRNLSPQLLFLSLLTFVLEDSYYVAFPNDRKIFKLLVYGVFLIETLETGLATSDAFAIFASDFLKKGSPVKAHLAWLEVPVSSGIGMFPSIRRRHLAL